MKSLPEGCCDLIYIDPPFVTQKPRTAGARKQQTRDPSFDDRWPGGTKAFLAFLHPRLVECHRLLPDTGTLYVHLDYRAAAYIRVMLDTIFGERNFLNEIIWQYRTGGASRRWFARKHDTILAYAKKSGRHTFHVQRGGAYRTDGLNHDENGRPYKTTRKGRLYFNQKGPILSDVWDIPFLSTVSLERSGWPTQKPLALLSRIVQASSNPGDAVADFFCGSGTALVAARRHGRSFVGCDLSKEAVRIARDRVRKETKPEA
ncbi:MAG: site-specific DNA-methyltransferase [Phycisphaerales bacterium]|nr:site-specific DNA-methyltransferase [Phycisphaerales bacterium]MCB9857409.1 site-specific DNA-methyltransferase [Phycisphaerales bacterium]